MNDRSPTNGLPYYKRYPRDLIEGTIGMSFELKACYALVLDLIYMQNGSLPDDARYISGLLGCSVRAWNKWRKELVDLGKIIAENGIISNFRADKELESLRTFQDNQRKKAAQPRKNNGLAKAPAKPERSHTESESKKERTTNVVPKKAARGTRLPIDWKPSDADADWCRKKYPGIAKRFVDDETEKFQNYWQSKTGADATKLDWSKTWRNWMMTAMGRAAGRSKPPPPSRPKDALDFGLELAREFEHATHGRHQPDQPTARQLPSPEPERDGS